MMPPLPALAAALTAFQTALADPQRTQRRMLADILAANRDTLYGRRHGFARIGCYETSPRTVPVAAYEDLRPLIERTAARARGLLTTEAVVCFEETGGSTGGAKPVPYTESLYAAFRRAVLPCR